MHPDREESSEEQVEQEIGDAITAVLSAREGGFVIKWVALIETVDPSGERGLWTLTSDNIRAWETIGLLRYGLQVQDAQVTKDVFTDEP